MPIPPVEIVPVPDAFALGASMDGFAEYVRLTYWVDQGSERVIVARIVMPLAAYHRFVADLVGAPLVNH